MPRVFRSLRTSFASSDLRVVPGALKQVTKADALKFLLDGNHAEYFCEGAHLVTALTPEKAGGNTQLE